MRDRWSFFKKIVNRKIYQIIQTFIKNRNVIGRYFHVEK